jgi:N-acylneuraminate cytidylyltransferase
MTEPLAEIELLVLDFDGVLTDNAVWVLEDGTEMVRCDRSDGLGLAALAAAGVPVVVLSTETNGVVAARCRKLGLPCVQGVSDKAAALSAMLRDRGIDAAHVAYVGNDVNDLGSLALVGLPVAVADAHPAVLSIAALRLSRPGGHGAVREFCDLLLKVIAPRP